MQISPISSAHAFPTAPASNRPAAEEKITDSCREFEGVLWRQIVEKSLQPLLTSVEGGADKTGTYGYLIGDALAHSISGGPHSFASLLQTQLTPPARPSHLH